MAREINFKIDGEKPKRCEVAVKKKKFKKKKSNKKNCKKGECKKL